MKSKSFDLKQSSAKMNPLDKTIDFIGFYKPASETNKIIEKGIISSESPHQAPKRERSPNKNKKRSKQEQVNMTEITIDGSKFNASGSGNDIRVTSTPNTSKNQGTMKSIMKNKSFTEQSMDSDRPYMSSGKPKKRNKSVSFMLEDNEEVVIKRTKSDDSLKVNTKSQSVSKTKLKDKRTNLKKFNKNKQSEKENKAADLNNLHMDVDNKEIITQDKKPTKIQKGKKLLTEAPSGSAGDAASQSPEVKEKKKKLKKLKKHRIENNSEPTDTENNVNESSESKVKKPKKKKQSKPPPADVDNEGEPAAKSRKQDKADIAEDLENLSIGDNAHTLTNLLDEMTVADKDKRKKLRQKFNKNKKPKGPSNLTKVNKADTEKSEEVKEKVKWKKRRWNKDKKGDLDEEGLNSTIIVENLPISVMLSYRRLLTEQFVKHGPIRKIGVAEVYPTEESKPVFTTSIHFQTDAAAEQALEENSSYIEGSRIRVKRALPATQTTVVVRSYGELTDQALSTAFLGAGRIRSIRHLTKGKKAMSTAFIEFDGPESVERAIKTVSDTKIGGKKIHVSKFEIRSKKVKKQKNNGDSAADADSEDSND